MPALLHDLDTHYPLSREQIASFHEQGFIKLRDVLGANLLEHYGSRISALVRELGDKRPIEARDTYGKAFLQVMNLWERDQTAREFVFSKRLARIAAELMGVAGVRMYHDQALYKEPGGGFTPWHADQAYWPLGNNNCCTVWAPFQAVPLEMGPLEFSVTSHRADFGRNLVIGDESERVLAKTLKDLPVEVSAFALGEVSFHSGWTFHRAGPNRTERPRAVMTVIYFEDGMRLAKPASVNQEADLGWMPGAVIGEPIATPRNPKLF